MKANQKFMEADEAVSPVIGVILMVAITVVLAAVVFVLVSDLGDSGESAPDIAFSKSASDGTLTVVRADQNVDWADLVIADTDGVNDCTGKPADGTDVAAGVILDCSGLDAGSQVTITHTPTNTLIYSTTFA